MDGFNKDTTKNKNTNSGGSDSYLVPNPLPSPKTRPPISRPVATICHDDLGA